MTIVQEICVKKSSLRASFDMKKMDGITYNLSTEIKARAKCQTSHESNLMQLTKHHRFCLFAFGK